MDEFDGIGGGDATDKDLVEEEAEVGGEGEGGGTCAPDLRDEVGPLSLLHREEGVGKEDVGIGGRDEEFRLVLVPGCGIETQFEGVAREFERRGDGDALVHGVAELGTACATTRDERLPAAQVGQEVGRSHRGIALEDTVVAARAETFVERLVEDGTRGVGTIGREAVHVDDALAEGSVTEGDRTVGLYGDVVDAAVHEAMAIDVAVVEHGGRGGVVGEAVVLEIGIGVGRFGLTGVVAACHAPVALVVVVVGMDDGEALVVVEDAVGARDVAVVDDGVDVVPLPDGLVVIDVEHEQATAGHGGIPTRALTILEQVVLVGFGLVVDDVGIAALAERTEAIDLCIFVAEFDGCEPAADHLLVAGVACRREAAIVPATVREEVPMSDAVVAGIEGVVEVGQTHAVGELVADGADTLDVPTGIDFVGAGVGVDGHAIEMERGTAPTGERVFVGPDGVGGAAIAFAQAGIEDEHLIDLAIAVPVVVGKVDAGVSFPAGFDDHQVGIHVNLAAALAVVGVGTVHTDGTHHVEVEFETPSALRQEVVLYRALEASLTESNLVEDAQVERLVVALLELLVGEVGKDDETFLAAYEFVGGILLTVGTATKTSAPHSFGLRGGSLCLECLDGSGGVAKRGGVEDIAGAIGRKEEVEAFVATELGGDLPAIGEGDGAPRAGLGGHGQGNGKRE